jgi:fructose-1,6-bisphosphatase
MDEIRKEVNERQDLAFDYYARTLKTIKIQEDRNKLINLKSIQDTTIDHLLGIIEKYDRGIKIVKIKESMDVSR